MQSTKYDLYVNGDKTHSITEAEYKTLRRAAIKDYRVLIGAFFITTEPAFFVMGHTVRMIGLVGGLASICAAVTAKNWLPIVTSQEATETALAVSTMGTSVLLGGIILGMVSGVHKHYCRGLDGPIHLAVIRKLRERYAVNAYADVKLRFAIESEEA